MPLPSFPPRLLRTNDVRSDAEVLEVQPVIHRGPVLLRNTDTHSEKYCRVAQHVNQSLSILSISRRLPFDILAEMFSHFCEKSADVRLLGRVCKSWKAATLALPALWSMIDFGLSPPMILSHLENSKSHPLTVYIGSSCHSASIKLLVQHSERWESATLSMGSSEAVALLEPIRGRLPLLRRLKYRDPVSRARPPCLVQIAPRLLHVSVATAGTVILPWVQLYSLCLQKSVCGLEFAKNLVELTVHHPPHNLSKPMVLPHLRKLRIGQGRLLHNLTCPVLEDLYLGSNGPLLAVPFLVRSECPLRKFTSEYEGLVASDVKSIVNLLPTLIELRILYIRNLKNLLSHLTIPPNDAAFRPAAPALRAIALTNIIDFTTCAALIKMIESRRCSQCPILSLCVLNFEARPQALTSWAETTSALLRDEYNIEVECLASDVAKAKMRSWELDYPYPW